MFTVRTTWWTSVIVCVLLSRQLFGPVLICWFFCYQDNFVEMGGVKALTALLHSENSRIMQEAASAIYGIVSESDEHKNSVVMDHG